MSEPVLDGARLRNARLTAGLNQAELGKQIGVQQPHISAMEAGHRSPSIEVLKKIAAALGVSVHWLCGEDLAHLIVPPEMRPEVIVEDKDAPSGLIALAGDARLIQSLEIRPEEWTGLRSLNWPRLTKQGYVAVLLALRGHTKGTAPP
jgi:transcriptional regulator with XRE-family HTH domain